jgi:hypothetical protein
MEASTIQFGRRARLRHWLRGDGPSSRGAQLFLFVSALLCGAAVSGLLFAGIWRHTAGEVARTRDAQLGDHRALVAAKQALAALQVKAYHEHALLGSAESSRLRAAGALADSRRALARIRRAAAKTDAAAAAERRSLSVQSQELLASASVLARLTTTIRSELNALETYARSPGGTGVDAGYVASQASYLVTSAESAASAADELVRRAQALASMAATRR